MLAKFITQMLSGEQPTIFGDGEQSRDFTYIDNAVEANLLACKAPAVQVAGKVFNVATGRRVTRIETFKLLKKLTRIPVRLYMVPAGRRYEAFPGRHLPGRKESRLYTQVNFEEGLRKRWLGTGGSEIVSVIAIYRHLSR